MKRRKKQQQEEGSVSLQRSEASLGQLSPGWATVDSREAVMVGLPASASAYFPTGVNGGAISSQDTLLGRSSSSDTRKISRHLPEERTARYAILRLMAQDPTIDSAIKMHIANALSANSESGESVFIECRDGVDKKDEEVVASIRTALMPIVNKDLNEWARKAAVYGSCFARVYGSPGVGISHLRCDYYTHPRFVQKFEKGGRLAGYTTTYQGTNTQGKQLRLLSPWTFVGFEIPEWWDVESVEPITVGGLPVDLSVDDPTLEGLIESQEYGTSLIATCYGPWLDLLDAICSMNMSRRNAARLERLVGVNTGRLDPERAARYLDMVAERLINASADIETQSWREGNVQTVVNHVLPVFGDKGSMQVDTVQGTPDINGLEDVLFHVKRLGSAVGVDPSLLGFGDMLSGGLGDGGFFRMSVMASVKANLLRQAIKNGIQRLCDIHVAYKYGKVFLGDTCPWKITFNAVSTALEREEQESLEQRSNVAGGIIAAIGTVDQEFSLADRRALLQAIWKMLRLNDEQFDAIFPAEKAKQAEAATPPSDDGFE